MGSKKVTMGDVRGAYDYLSKRGLPISDSASTMWDDAKKAGMKGETEYERNTIYIGKYLIWLLAFIILGLVGHSVYVEMFSTIN